MLSGHRPAIYHFCGIVINLSGKVVLRPITSSYDNYYLQQLSSRYNAHSIQPASFLMQKRYA